MTMSEQAQPAAITPRGIELGGTAPAGFDAVAMARRLLRTGRTGALATLDPASGFPLSTLINVATDVDGTPLLLASKLALHRRNFEADPRASILLASLGKGDPMANSHRLSVVGLIEPAADPRALRRFLARHPKSKLYAGFPDFALFRLRVEAFHPNGGFARAADLAVPEILLDLAGCEALIEAEESAVAHMNADHADALRLYATVLLGAADGRWRATGLDPEGLDLVCGERTERLVFPEPVTNPGALRKMLAGLAGRARAA
jgi:hypothetical protein